MNIVPFCFQVRTICSLVQVARGVHTFTTLRELARQKLDADHKPPTLW